MLSGERLVKLYYFIRSFLPFFTRQYLFIFDMRIGVKIVFLFLLLSTSVGLCQRIEKDSVYVLKEVPISTNRLKYFAAGSKIIAIDSTSLSQYANQNLSELLSDDSPLFVKSYGMGSLGTSSFRGGSANHTAVLWNGFNINNPWNGQMDLSLVPVDVADNVSVQYGGNSALWGSGAVGGAIHLSNNGLFNKGITSKISLSTGSFETYSQQLSAEYSGSRFITSIKFFNTDAKNNFEYSSYYFAEKTKLKTTNAELKNYGFLNENYFLINENQKINLFFWYQNTNRNIPPTMLQQSNTSNESDANWRISTEWKQEKKRMTNYVRAAFFNERLNYTDKIHLMDERNNDKTFITEAESRIKLNTNYFANIGINNTNVKASASGYSFDPQQNRTALFASIKFISQNEKISSNISIRQELIDKKLVPFTFSWGSDFQMLKWFMLKASIAKVYRIPTFNDLYWSPGGNPDLLPESGYTEEVGMKLNLISKSGAISFSNESTIFNRTMKNWIIWLPGKSYWSPQNMMNVWSRGLETNSALCYKINKLKFSFSVLTNYVVSTSQNKSASFSSTYDKQLIYIPMYSGHAKVGLEFFNFLFSYRQSYTGYRYTSTDNTQYLNPYQLGSFYLSYSIALKKTRLSVFAKLNNAWDEEYQAVLNRAMPLRNYNAGISLEFNKPNNN